MCDTHSIQRQLCLIHCDWGPVCLSASLRFWSRGLRLRRCTLVFRGLRAPGSERGLGPLRAARVLHGGVWKAGLGSADLPSPRLPPWVNRRFPLQRFWYLGSVERNRLLGEELGLPGDPYQREKDTVTTNTRQYGVGGVYSYLLDWSERKPACRISSC